MPLYDYVCAACGRRFEVVHGVHGDPPTSCPLCGSGPVRKAISAPSVHFKGSGWAKKERRAGTRTGAGTGSGGDSAGGEGSSSEEVGAGTSATSGDGSGEGKGGTTTGSPKTTSSKPSATTSKTNGASD